MSTIVLEGGSPRSLVSELRRLVQHRDLLLLLTQKDLKLKYKGTALGFVWSFLNPLLMMIVYATVFSVVARVSMPNYPVFLLAGMLPWNAFIISINTASMTIVEPDTNRNLSIDSMPLHMPSQRARRSMLVTYGIRFSSWYWATSFGRGGRGPTSDISPRKTFHNWGSSSSEVRRSHLPTLVMRGSLRILNSGPFASFRCK